MQKLIPAVLAAVVVVGLVMATIPVEKAATIHGGVDINQCVETANITPVTDNDDVDFDLAVTTTAGAFKITGLYIDFTAASVDDGIDNDDEGFTMTQFTVDDTAIINFGDVRADGDGAADTADSLDNINGVFSTDPAAGDSVREVDIDFNLDTNDNNADETDGIGTFTVTVCGVAQRSGGFTVTPSSTAP